MNQALLIFGWHNVETTYGFPSAPGAGPAGMARQFEFLARFANVVSLPDAVQAFEESRPLPRRAVVVTFDDGYRDNHELAAPILQRYGLPATFFLSPDLLDGVVSPWWEELAWAFHFTPRHQLRWQNRDLPLEDGARRSSFEALIPLLKRLNEIERRRSVRTLVSLLEPADPAGEHRSPVMGWDEAEDLQRQGFTIGSHAMRHSILAREPAGAQACDLARSRAILQERLGCAADLLAYPNGEVDDFDRSTVQASTDAGFRAAVTTIHGWNGTKTPRMELRRFVMYPEWGVRGFGIVPRHVFRNARSRLGKGR